MRKHKNTFIVLSFMLLAPSLLVQEGFVHKESEQYVWPTNEKLLNKLDEWQDLKFGVLFNWGLYSVPGIVELWSICSEDVD